METLVILDYATASVHIFKVNKDVNIDYDYINNLGFGIKADNCYWMIAEDIEFIKHKGVLV